MTEYKCKKCKMVFANRRLIREHVRKVHWIKKDLKSFYVEYENLFVSKNNPFYRLGDKIMKVFRRGKIATG